MNSAVQSVVDADWYQHYGFDRDPFAEGGVHGLFYPGGARQETVQQLLHLARFSDCVLLVIGVAGAGKSATRRHFAAQTAADTRCCVVEAALLDGPEQWLRRVLAGFALRPSGQLEADMRALAEYCAARAKTGSHCWLVIDDAHDLHEEVVAILPQLLRLTAPHLRLVLFAEPRWRGTLHAALPPDVALHTLELQPFDQGETYAYLHYRLNTAGLDGEPPFNAQEFQRIHQQSGGIPGRINALAREILCSAATEVQQPLSALPLWHFAVIAATLLALLLLYVWGAIDQDSHRPPDASPAVGTVAPDSGATDVPSLQIAPEPAEQQHELGAPSIAPGPGAPDAVAPASIELVQGTDEVAGQDEDGIAAQRGDAEMAAGTVPADLRGENAETVPIPNGPGTIESTPVEPDALEAIPDPLEVEEAEPTASSPPAVAAADSGSSPTGAVESTTPAIAAPVQGPEARSGGDATPDESLLLAMDPTHYVLQIMGSDDGRRVRAYAERSGVELRLYRKLHNGREWFALVHGEYATRADAEAAVAGLPRAMRDGRPWVRRVDGIQQEIRAARAL